MGLLALPPSSRLATRRVIGDRRTLSKRLHLRDRQGEWYSALAFLICAAIFALPGDSLQGPTWKAFHQYGLTEAFWTWAFTIIGSARVVALIVNGSMQLVTPVVRLTGAMMGGFVWAQAASLLLEGTVALYGTPTPGVGLFLLLGIAECFNVYMAAMDVRAQPG